MSPSSINAKEILDGNNPKHEVISYVPFEDNPHLVNPPNGVIVTANNLSSLLMLPFSISPFILCYLSINNPHINEEVIFLIYFLIYSFVYLLLRKKRFNF